MRYFFKISYNGKQYHGWQRQKNAVSVQETIESHLSKILRSPADIVGSGRTDTGVHARQQYFHLDQDVVLDSEKIRGKLNSFLPCDIAVDKIFTVEENAHARFDAIQRSYEYWIIRDKDPFLDDLAYRFSADLDIDKMNNAAQLLLGKHDFESFSRVKTDVNNFFCEITRAEWIQDSGILKFHISANRFLRGMVRTIVGTLIDIGSGNSSLNKLEGIIESKDRKRAGRAVPAKGLYLTGVKYPDSIFK